MTSPRLRALLPAALLTAAIASSTLTGCTSPTDAAATTADGAADGTAYTPGTVVRVIDGDTLVIAFNGEDQTVRLLNVDTPETKHPDKPVECLGLEATEELESLTPPGTEVGLDFDVERTDRYDRVLAAVFIEDTTLVNAELARMGLGVPVLIEPNRKYYDDVQAAYAEATAQGVGLMDPAAGCTLPTAADDALEALAAATAASVGDSADSASATAAGIVAALVAAKAVRESVNAGKDTVRVLALGTAGSASLLADLDRRITEGERALTTATGKAESFRAADAAAQRTAEKEAAAKAAADAEAARVVEAARVEAERVAAEAAARAEADRIAAEAERVAAEATARAEADRLAAEAAERDRIANLPPAPAPYIPPAPAPPAPPAADNPYPGYTGPRCYAPGGKTWRPC